VRYTLITGSGETSLDRYKIISAMLKDPVNLACAMREISRKGLKLLPPPRPLGDGYVFLSMEHAEREGILDHYEPGDRVESVYLIYGSADSWYVLKTLEDSEVGPFDSRESALAAAKNFVTRDGYVLLEEAPWGAQEVLTYPIKS
jgi:hypothetical protein